jgi:hypothetical protein
MPINSTVTLDLPEGGQVVLRILTVGDSERLDTWVFADIAPRELALRVLAHQLLEAPTNFVVGQLSDADLARLVWRWLQVSEPGAWPDPEVVDLPTLQQRLRDHYQQERARWHAMFERMTGGDAFRGLIEAQVNASEAARRMAEAMMPAAHVLRHIAETQSSVAQAMIPINSSWAAVQNAITPLRQIGPLVTGLDSLTSALQPMQAFADQVAQSLATVSFQVPNLSAFRTTFTNGIIGTGQEFLIRYHAAYEVTTETLEAHQLRFAGGILPLYVVMRISQLANPTRSVIARLGGWLRSPQFRDELMESLGRFPRSRRRMGIMRDALRAHSERRYALSVPVFIAQAEGMLTDFLVQAGLVRRVGARVFAADPASGDFKRGRDGKRIQLVGWDPKLQSARLTADAIMEDLATDLVSVFVPQRNAILHGHALNYAEHRRSAYALLVAAATASTLSES